MNDVFILNDNDKNLLALSLREDLSDNFCDVTSEFLFPKSDMRTEAMIISKEKKDVVMAGLAILPHLAALFPEPLTINTHKADGETIATGEKIVTLSGSAKTLSMIERVLLNFLRHLSGVATQTRCFVDLISDTTTKILDTRKTTPGLRHLEKYAVQCGGGVNHRMGLYDALMIKDTHVDSLGGMEKVLLKLPETILEQYPVIVEIRTVKELDIVLTQASHKVSRVLLDNMNIDTLQHCVDACQGIMPTEASGNINLETIQSIAATGVDYASVGMITHSAKQVDLSMKNAS